MSPDPSGQSRRAFVRTAYLTSVYDLTSIQAAQRERDSPKPMKDLNIHRLLEQVSDRLAIEDILARYCYAVDDRDWSAYRQVFTPEAIIDDTVTGGIKSGIDDHIAYMKRALSKILMSQHAVSTIRIDLNGNESQVRAHCSCPMVLALGNGSTQVFFQGLWYRAQLTRTNDGWKIKHLLEEGYWKNNVPAGFKF
jgi:SnoaL-like domain